MTDLKLNKTDTDREEDRPATENVAASEESKQTSVAANMSTKIEPKQPEEEELDYDEGQNDLPITENPGSAECRKKLELEQNIEDVEVAMLIPPPAAPAIGASVNSPTKPKLNPSRVFDSAPTDPTTRDQLEKKPPPPTTQNKCLWISGLSQNTRAADLKNMFLQVGRVPTAKIISSKTPGLNQHCFGFVVMSTIEEAREAVEKFSNTKLHDAIIKVELTKHDNLATMLSNLTTEMKTSGVRAISPSTKQEQADETLSNSSKRQEIKPPRDDIKPERPVTSNRRAIRAPPSNPNRRAQGVVHKAAVRMRLSSRLGPKPSSLTARRPPPPPPPPQRRRPPPPPPHIISSSRRPPPPPPSRHHSIRDRSSYHRSSESRHSVERHSRRRSRSHEGEKSRELKKRYEEKLKMERERQELKLERERLEKERLELENAKLRALGGVIGPTYYSSSMEQPISRHRSPHSDRKRRHDEHTPSSSNRDRHLTSSRHRPPSATFKREDSRRDGATSRSSTSRREHGPSPPSKRNRGDDRYSRRLPPMGDLQPGRSHHSEAYYPNAVRPEATQASSYRGPVKDSRSKDYSSRRDAPHSSSSSSRYHAPPPPPDLSARNLGATTARTRMESQHFGRKDYTSRSSARSPPGNHHSASLGPKYYPREEQQTKEQQMQAMISVMQSQQRGMTPNMAESYNLQQNIAKSLGRPVVPTFGGNTPTSAIAPHQSFNPSLWTSGSGPPPSSMTTLMMSMPGASRANFEPYRGNNRRNNI